MSDSDRLIWELGSGQDDVVAIWQLLRLGVTRREIDRRLSDRRLHRLFRGVYALGSPRVSLRGRWRAATLAYGADAALSHSDGAAFRDLMKRPPGPIHVTVPGRHPRPQRGIVVHTARSLHHEDVTTIDGIRVTSLARTLLDLATVASPAQLRRAYEKAERIQQLDRTAIEALLERSNGHRGAGPLRALLEYDPTAAAAAESKLERLFLDLVREEGLPAPQTNVLVDGFLVDAYWPEANLVVELDGYEFHRERDAFERDRQRIARMRLAGREVVPFTHRQVTACRREVVATVRELLRRAQGSGPSGSRSPPTL